MWFHKSHGNYYQHIWSRLIDFIHLYVGMAWLLHNTLQKQKYLESETASELLLYSMNNSIMLRKGFWIQNTRVAKIIFSPSFFSQQCNSTPNQRLELLFISFSKWLCKSPEVYILHQAISIRHHDNYYAYTHSAMDTTPMNQLSLNNTHPVNYIIRISYRDWRPWNFSMHF